MNTVQLECFLAVAEYLNFSKAAELLRITQPAVSHQIKALEDELGARLFIRTSKNVMLTDAGLQFLDDASSILKIAKTARNRLSLKDTKEFLFFNMGCHNISELTLVPPLLKQLCDRFPNLHPSIKLISFHSMAGLLEDERIHAMFGFLEQDQKQPAEHFCRLFHCPVVCVCTKNHPLSEHSSITLDMLKGDMIICDPHKLPPSVFLAQKQASAHLSPENVYFSDSYESSLAMTQAGIGCTILPGYPTFRDAGLCAIPVQGFAPMTYGIYYKTVKDNSVLKEFLSICKTQFTDN